LLRPNGTFDVVYSKHRIAWRKDKAELLFYSPQFAAEVEGWFGQPSG
jgi:hypothetical protein